jgi:hypothetical protein
MSYVIMLFHPTIIEYKEITYVYKIKYIIKKRLFIIFQNDVEIFF